MESALAPLHRLWLAIEFELEKTTPRLLNSPTANYARGTLSNCWLLLLRKPTVRNAPTRAEFRV